MPSSRPTCAHLEDCIVYHEQAITRYALMKERLVRHQLMSDREFAGLNAAVAQEEKTIERLRTALQSSGQ